MKRIFMILGDKTFAHFVNFAIFFQNLNFFQKFFELTVDFKGSTIEECMSHHAFPLE